MALPAGPRPSFTLIKSGLLAGGASHADIAFCAHAERLGIAAPRIVTGGIDRHMGRELDSSGVPYEVDERLDRDYSGDQTMPLTKLVQREAARHSAVIFSQPFCSGKGLAIAATEIASIAPVAYRHHNPFVAYERCYADVIRGLSVPNQRALAARCRVVNPRVDVVEMNPTLVGAVDLPPDGPSRAARRRALRSALGIRAGDFLALQSTRVNSIKGVDVSLQFAGELQRLLAQSSARPLTLLYAGRLDQPGLRCELLSSCAAYGLDPARVRFLDGELRGLEATTLLELALASDVVLAPSRRDTFCMTIGEACLAMVPFVTTRWGDEVARDNYAEVYESRGIRGWTLDLERGPDSLAAQLRRTANDLMSRFGGDGTVSHELAEILRRNREVAEEHFVRSYVTKLRRILSAVAPS